MPKKSIIPALVLSIAAAVALCGCGDLLTVDVTGSWDVVSSSGYSGVMTLNQTGSVVTGRIPAIGGMSGPITDGRVEGNTLTMSCSTYSYYSDMTATVFFDSMSGTWSSWSIYGSDQGTWSATRQ